MTTCRYQSVVLQQVVCNTVMDVLSELDASELSRCDGQ